MFLCFGLIKEELGRRFAFDLLRVIALLHRRPIHLHMGSAACFLDREWKYAYGNFVENYPATQKLVLGRIAKLVLNAREKVAA
jgi:hypothetical protein